MPHHEIPGAYTPSPGPALTLQDAVASLYEIAVLEGKATSTSRLQQLGHYCIAELARRGLRGAQTEITVPGGGRPKKWDVVWTWQRKPRLVISLKSILQNPGGTVPNRIDDLMGEVSNVQMYSPEIVTGYLMIFDASCERATPRTRRRRIDSLRDHLAKLSGRRAPAWSIGLVEAALVIEVDFSQGPKLITPLTEVDSFFETLVQEVRERNPGLVDEAADGCVP